MNFNFTPTLSDGTVSISQLEDNDFDALYKIASDKLLWAGHPKKDRYKREVFEQWFKDAITSRHALKIYEEKTGLMIGSSRYYEYDAQKKEIAIGYTFIGRAYWGGETNKRVKTLMINHAFKSVNTIWLHADPSNIRSQKAIKKLGSTYSHLENKKLGNGEVEQYYCYQITKSLWLSQN